MAVIFGSTGGGAIEALLHARLRIASLITLGPVLLFLIRNFVKPDAADFLVAWELPLHSLVTAVLLGVALYLWLHKSLAMWQLRTVELVLFGSLTVFFAWLQYQHFPRCAVLSDLTVEQRTLLIRMDLSISTFRWFFLIVIYGVFIPNTWRRCLGVTSVMALTPLVLTPIAASTVPCVPQGMSESMFHSAIGLGTAIIVAVFGSYRIHLLQEKAFEAQQLGQYKLLELLGAGGMGEVFKAEHVLLRRPCAVKLIRRQQAGDPTSLQRFEREVRTMATLTHPNTVEIFDYGHTDDGTFYYVMEYLPGQNLETLVAQTGPLPPARVIHFLRQVCGALREAHNIGLLHRDIKPSNIIACERGGVPDVAKLLDFGLVRGSTLTQETDRLTQLGTIVGSPPYMSPEQAAGKSMLDARSDIYSLGAVAYYLLTGQPPFVRETAMLTLLAHAYEPVVPPDHLQPGIPADLQAVVLRCLEKNPAQRFADVPSLERALAACEDAGRWNEADAAAWWHSQQPEDAEPKETAALPNRVTVP
jgi:serine/threonine-protein kinase